MKKMSLLKKPKAVVVKVEKEKSKKIKKQFKERRREARRRRRAKRRFNKMMRMKFDTATLEKCKENIILILNENPKPQETPNLDLTQTPSTKNTRPNFQQSKFSHHRHRHQHNHHHNPKVDSSKAERRETKNTLLGKRSDIQKGIDSTDEEGETEEDGFKQGKGVKQGQQQGGCCWQGGNGKALAKGKLASFFGGKADGKGKMRRTYDLNNYCLYDICSVENNGKISKSGYKCNQCSKCLASLQKNWLNNKEANEFGRDFRQEDFNVSGAQSLKKSKTRWRMFIMLGFLTVVIPFTAYNLLCYLYHLY